MTPFLRKHGTRVLLYGTGAAIGVWLLVYGPKAQQTRNMKRAEEHIAKVAPLLRNDARFENVVLKPYTGRNGSIVVMGSVSSHADMREVRDTIIVSNPPVPVVFQLQLLQKDQESGSKTEGTIRPVEAERDKPPQ